MTNSNNLIPTCVGFIMDGNRRWAKEQGLLPLEGHSAGKEVFVESIKWVRETRIPHAVYYAFSTENWQRGETEVAGLLELFSLVVAQILAEVDTHQVRVRVIGGRQKFPSGLQEQISKLEELSSVYTEVTVWVALSYGGRAEITAAVNQAITKGENVTEDSFSNFLSTAGMPDPDLIIRTGGEQRLSNFLPWQSIYSELMFTATYWPAFTKAEFVRMLDTYEQRHRRRGQ